MGSRSVRPLWSGGFSFVPLLILTVSLAAALPSAGSSQGVLGDPSSTLGRLGRFRVDAGGGALTDQGLRYGETSVAVATSPRTYSFAVPEFDSDMESEEFFATATIGVGSLGDVFGSVGQVRLKGEGFRGDRALSGAGGVRISPPQPGMIRLGLLLQAHRSAGEDRGIAGGLTTQNATPGTGDETSLYATGIGSEKVSVTRFDALLGFGAHTLPLVRPYGGVLLSVLEGRDDVALAGEASYTTCPVGGGLCGNGTEPFSTRFRATFDSDKMVGAVAGIVVSANDRVGVTLEGRFLSQTAYAMAAHYRF